MACLELMLIYKNLFPNVKYKLLDGISSCDKNILVASKTMGRLAHLKHR